MPCSSDSISVESKKRCPVKEFTFFINVAQVKAKFTLGAEV
jgi:hypothetical protein